MELKQNEVKELGAIIKKIRKAEISDTEQKINKIVCAIIEERKNKEFSQSELAAMTGLPQTTISRIETFVSTPTLPVLIRILSALNMEITITYD